MKLMGHTQLISSKKLFDHLYQKNIVQWERLNY